MGSDDEIKLSDNQVIKARPDINDISKRNEIEEKQEKKIIYIRTGIIVLLVVVVVLLVYFFSWIISSKLWRLIKKGNDTMKKN